jgi:hypothetical protein
MSKILAAVGARTPAERRQWAGKILAAVHLRSLPKDQAVCRELLLPAVWRQTPQGLAHLTADGFGALVPNYLKPDQAGRISCFGRRYALDQLWSASGQPVPAAGDDRDTLATLSRLAMTHDLEGV